MGNIDIIRKYILWQSLPRPAEAAQEAIAALERLEKEIASLETVAEAAFGLQNERDVIRADLAAGAPRLGEDTR